MSNIIYICLPRWGSEDSLYIFLSWISFVRSKSKVYRFVYIRNGSLHSYQEAFFPSFNQEQIDVLDKDEIVSKKVDHQTIVFLDDHEILSLESENLRANKLILTFSLSLIEVNRIKKLTHAVINNGAFVGNCHCLLLKHEDSNEFLENLIRKSFGMEIIKWETKRGRNIEGEIERCLNNIKPENKKMMDDFDSLLSIIDKEPTNKNNTDASMLEKEIYRKISEKFWKKVSQKKEGRIKDKKRLEEILFRVISEEFLRNQWDFENDWAENLKQKLKDEIFGFGLIEKYFRDGEITEIMINGPKNIFVERNGFIEKAEENFDGPMQLDMVIDRLVSESGCRIDFLSPMADFRLKNGFRANLAIKPVSLQGPVLTIRKYRENFIDFSQLLKNKSLEERHVKTLTRLVEEKKNILVSGNSGSGKTTLLNILSSYFDATERIITLEDTAELKIPRPHVVRFETRNKNAEGLGEVSLKDLVINALRMRPDRLIVGECRGDEVIPMLQAMNTGHNGSLCTLHANSAQEVPSRLESMVLMGAPQWPIRVIGQQINSGFDVIVHLKRIGSKRILDRICSIEFIDGVFKLNDLD